MSIENLKEMAKKVAELRIEVQDKWMKTQEAHEFLLKSEIGQRWLSWLDKKIEADKFLGDAEAELKAAAVVLYNETKEKRPIDKVEIKIFKELDYDPKEVETWCRTFSPAMLTLNKKAFEKVAENLTDAPVKVNVIPKCNLGTDLSQYLEEKKEGE